MDNFKQQRLFGLKVDDNNILEVEVPCLKPNSPVIILKLVELPVREYRNHLTLFDEVAYVVIDRSDIAFVIRLAREILKLIPSFFPKETQEKILKRMREEEGIIRVEYVREHTPYDMGDVEEENK